MSTSLARSQLSTPSEDMPMDVAKPQDPEAIVIEAWAQGYMIGSLIIMACVAFSNMRSRVLLHKLIVIEVSMTRSRPDMFHMLTGLS